MVQGSIEQWRITVGPMRNLHLFDDMVIVIGENALWEVNNAKILKTKVLEDDISYGTIIDKHDDYNVMIANFQYQLLIYSSEYVLLWAVKLDSIALRICIFK